MERKLLRVSEAAEKVYGCTKQNLYKLIRAGKLKTYKRYGVTVISVEDVERLAREIEPRGGDRKFKPQKS
ncbi:helix-turn-helix domain-containing protein [bacterium]|nr:helix-turn-helix domain-containing protein [bacterium]